MKVFSISASSRENLSSGCATRVDLNRPAQLQKLVRGLKLDIETSGIILAKQRTTKVLIRLICTFVVRIWHKQVFSRRGSFKKNV